VARTEGGIIYLEFDTQKNKEEDFSGGIEVLAKYFNLPLASEQQNKFFVYSI
jgi:hypothetical protein